MTTLAAPLPLAVCAVVLALASATSSILAGKLPSVLRTISLPLFGLAGLSAMAGGITALLDSAANVSIALPVGLP